MDVDWTSYLNDGGDEFNFADIDYSSGASMFGITPAFVEPAMNGKDVKAEHTASATDGYPNEPHTSGVLDAMTIDPSLLYRSNFSSDNPNSTSLLQNGHATMPSEICETESNALDASGDALITATKVKKRRTNLPSAAVAILKTWLFEHESDPYPTEAEKLELSARSGLQPSQVNYWFMNARKRTLHSGYESSVSVSESESVRSTANARGQISQRSGHRRRSTSTESISSFTWDSDSSVSRPPKRGRKRMYSNDRPANNHKRSRSVLTTIETVPDAKTEMMFQCTFCRMELTSKSWRRHEETQHAPQVSWTCMATGPTLETGSIGPKMKASMCAFCGDIVNCDCPKAHRIADCQAREENERVFYRKEHLRQHFRNFHPESKLTDQVAAAWKSMTNTQPRFWPCGFCNGLLGNWSLRESHIAQHFREGATMDSWSLNRPRQYYQRN